MAPYNEDAYEELEDKRSCITNFSEVERVRVTIAQKVKDLYENLGECDPNSSSFISGLMSAINDPILFKDDIRFDPIYYKILKERNDYGLVFYQLFSVPWDEFVNSGNKTFSTEVLENAGILVEISTNLGEDADLCFDNLIQDIDKTLLYRTEEDPHTIYFLTRTVFNEGLPAYKTMEYLRDQVKEENKY